jgi:parallel beta-helix repeat protein
LTMKRTLPVAVLLLVTLVFTVFGIQFAASQTPQAITINLDGTVTPSSAPLQLIDGTYFLSQNTSMPLVIKRDNTVFDGNGYTLLGDGNGTAINLACTNATVRNVGVAGWQTGILSGSNNNTLTQNWLTGNYYGVAVYAAHNTVAANYFEGNREGIHIEGSSNTVTLNQIRGNTYGVMEPTNVIQNTLTKNNLKNNTAAVCTTNALLQTYLNNFVNNAYDIQVIQAANVSVSDLTRFWDNGSEGNYWSSHPNQTEYVVHASSPQVIDRFPLASPVTVPEVSLPQPKPVPTPAASTFVPTSSPETPTPIEQHSIDSVTVELALTVALIGLGVAVFFASRVKASPTEPAS